MCIKLFTRQKASESLHDAELVYGRSWDCTHDYSLQKHEQFGLKYLKKPPSSSQAQERGAWALLLYLVGLFSKCKKLVVPLIIK